MEKTTKMLLLVIMMMSMGEAIGDMEDIAKELRIEMAQMKTDLKAKDVSIQQLERDISATKEDLKTKDVSIGQLEKDISATKENLLSTKAELLTIIDYLKTKDATIKYLEREVSNLRDPPFTFACGAHYDFLSITSTTISYSTLLYSSTNVDGPHGLDISDGVFTAGYPGTYTATWSLTANDDAEDHFVQIYLRKNGETIEESLHSSWYTGSSGWVTDQGGRTLVLHLGRGDTLDLYCKDCSAGMYYTTFCVSLSQADVE